MPKPTAKNTKQAPKVEEVPKGKNKPNKKIAEDIEEEEEIEKSDIEEEIEDVKPAKNKKAQAPAQNGKSKKVQEMEEEEDDEEEEVQPAKNKKQAQKQNGKGKKAQEMEEEEEEEEGDDEDDEEVFDAEIGDDDIYIPKKKVKTEQGAIEKGKKELNKKIKGELNGAVNESEIKPRKGKADRFKKAEEEEPAVRGILYIGHLPYGFMEDGLREYFSQYGEILNLHLARSKKTARSMGYAFIEYKYKEVAKIAADSMNGYMFYGKKLVCRVLEDDEGVKVRTKKFRFIPNNKKFIEERNRSKEPQELKKEVRHLLKKEEKRRQKLKDLGIHYEFPGFKDAIEKIKKTLKPEKQEKTKQTEKAQKQEKGQKQAEKPQKAEKVEKQVEKPAKAAKASKK